MAQKMAGPCVCVLSILNSKEDGGLSLHWHEILEAKVSKIKDSYSLEEGCGSNKFRLKTQS